MSKFPDEYILDGGLWRLEDEASTIAYTDGESHEAFLLSVVSQAEDLSSLSAELATQIKDWPSRYHLSPERSNLLRAIPLRADSKVLELGSGCGALTRYLGEHCARVVAVEGSLMRARIAAERCKDLPNVQVVAGNFDQIEFDEAFDVVTLIGVLEYADLYWRGQGDPFRSLLRRAHEWLTDNGVLILAIENRHGIKYYSGALEDHTNRRFLGVEGYPSEDGIRTFGRQGLIELARSSGFLSFQTLLPFPDYKIATSFINAAYTSAEEARRYNLVDWCRQPYPDHGRRRVELFSDHLALASLGADGLLADHANSFALLAHKSPIGPAAAIPRIEWIARKINIQRQAPFRTVTTLLLQEGTPVVRKELLQPEELDRSCRDLHRIEACATFIPDSISLSMKLLQAFRDNSARDATLRKFLGAWLEFLRQAETRRDYVPPEYLDCIPDNLLLDSDGELHYIDAEWHWHEDVPIGWVFLRGMLSLWLSYRTWIEKAWFQEPYTVAEYFRRCCQLAGISIPEEAFHSHMDAEAAFQAMVSSSTVDFTALMTQICQPMEIPLQADNSLLMEVEEPRRVNDRQRETNEVEARLSSEIDERLRFLLAMLETKRAYEDPPEECANEYDILIPIYDAYEETRRCIESVLRHTHPKHHVYLLDDASPDQRMEPMLRKFASANENVTWLRSATNLGFVQNVNRGFRLSRNHVVILNSDTQVTPGWLERMDRCLESSPSIGIVSPLSNNATILSVPAMNAINQLPSSTDPDEFAALVAQCSNRAYPRLPTAVGFCMLIARQVLDRVGEFDPIFGLGYGEENDFCMRAWAAGFETACCDDAYVHHYGQASFRRVEDIDERRAQNERTLYARWPQYLDAVNTFCHINPLREIQERILAALRFPEGDSRPHILQVMHNYDVPGGTELHTANILDGLKKEFRSTVIYPAPMPHLWSDMVTQRADSTLRIIRMRRENASVQDFFLEFPAELMNPIVEGNFARLVAGGDYDLIHFQHLGGWGTMLLPLIAKALGRKVVLSLHDYFLLCPEFNMILPEGRRCEKDRADAFDPACLACLGSRLQSASARDPKWIRRYLIRRNAIVDQVVASADLIIAPSRFTGERFQRAFGDRIANRLCILPHGVGPLGVSRRPKRIRRLRVGFLGHLTERKGGRVLLETARILKNEDVRFEVFGNVMPELREDVVRVGFKLNGPYQRRQLGRLLGRVDVVVIPSIGDETYCFTLSEAQSLGVPVIASDVGAISERVVDGKTGILVPPGDADALAEVLRELARGADIIEDIIEGLRSYQPKTIQQNAREYADIYSELCGSMNLGGELIRSLLKLDGRSAVDSGRSKYDPVETLALLLESGDILRALEIYEDRLDRELLALVRWSARNARASDDDELATAMDALADVVQQVIASDVERSLAPGVEARMSS